MAKKSLGYVHLEWTCPNCGTRNQGNQKDCVSCGAPQEQSLEFEQTASETLITDEETLAQAKKGPDIQCFYCDTRNPADAKVCSECGGDLTEGEARKKGQVVGAHRTGPAKDIACNACGTMNRSGAARCINCGASLSKPKPKISLQSKRTSRDSRQTTSESGSGIFAKIGTMAMVIMVIVVLACCAFLMFSTEDIGGRVESVAWKRTIMVEELVPVRDENWRDAISSDADIISCTQKLYDTQDSPTANSKEVCGTAYTVDQGNGFGEVVQDCRYQIYDDWCTYTVDKWQEAPNLAATLSGQDYNPRWPARPRLGRNQREGERIEQYQIFFDSDGEDYTYTTNNLNLFQQCQIGSRWVLEVNRLGIVMGIQPNR